MRETGTKHANGHGSFTGGWEKVEADVFEAYVAAVILADPAHGFETVEKWLTGCWAGILLREHPEVIINRKDELQKLIGTREAKIEYLDEEEDAHGQLVLVPEGQAPRTGGRTDSLGQQLFFVGCYITTASERTRLGGASAIGKKEAGMKAAGNAFETSKGLIEELSARKKREAEQRRTEKEKEERT